MGRLWWIGCGGSDVVGRTVVGWMWMGWIGCGGSDVVWGGCDGSNVVGRMWWVGCGGPGVVGR
jgi:hypothetical protein